MKEQEILELIEWVAGDGEDDPARQTNADKLLLNIYRIVHSHRKDACCHEVHKDWREQAEKDYQANKQYF